jgi:hypothetical protein
MEGLDRQFAPSDLPLKQLGRTAPPHGDLRGGDGRRVRAPCDQYPDLTGVLSVDDAVVIRRS